MLTVDTDTIFRQVFSCMPSPSVYKPLVQDKASEYDGGTGTIPLGTNITHLLGQLPL